MGGGEGIDELDVAGNFEVVMRPLQNSRMASVLEAAPGLSLIQAMAAPVFAVGDADHLHLADGGVGIEKLLDVAGQRSFLECELKGLKVGGLRVLKDGFRNSKDSEKRLVNTLKKPLLDSFLGFIEYLMGMVDRG